MFPPDSPTPMSFRSVRRIIEPSFIGLQDITPRAAFKSPECYHGRTPERFRMSSAASALGFREVLQSPEVKRLWIAQIVSIFGDFLAIFAVFSVVTFQLHGTATQVSMIMAAYLT